MPDFAVAFSNDKVEPYSGEGAGWKIIEGTSGVLRVLDGKGNRFHFSPTAWLCVEDKVSEAPLPSRAGGLRGSPSI